MTQEEARDFVKYSFYKVSPEWRRLSPQDRERGKEEFAATPRWGSSATVSP